MAHDVFISHASEDKALGDAVCATLEQEGLRCWMAPRDVLPGADWGASIMDALRGRRAVVLILSGAVNASPHVSREIERAIHMAIPVIPFRTEDVTPRGALEYHLGTVHWMDALTPPLEAHIKRLAHTLRPLVSAAPVPPGDVRTSVAAVPPPFWSVARIVAVASAVVLAIGLALGLMWVALQNRGGEPDAAPAPTVAAPAPEAAPAGDQQVNVLKAAASRDPADPAPRIALGNLFFDAGRHHEAAPWYAAALAVDPGNANVRTDLAVSYYYLQRTDEAIVELERVTRESPTHSKAWLNLGIVRAFGKQDLEGAAQAWRRVVEISPTSPEAERAAQALKSLNK